VRYERSKVPFSGADAFNGAARSETLIPRSRLRAMHEIVRPGGGHDDDDARADSSW